MGRRTVVLGAAGRDFHVFNTLLRDDDEVEVVAFTATQIPYIDDRRYPPALAGERYPAGIPIRPETELDDLVRTEQVDDCLFAYSDIDHRDVMHLASRVLAAGARFVLPGARETMLAADVPVVAVCAVRTGVGKSPTSRQVAAALKAAGRRPVVVRHPMPYGDLLAARVQRFATLDDLDAAGATVEEREEIEPHVAAGTVVFQGVDYADVLAAAQAEADVLIWDGGNNDLPFFRPDLHLVLVDPLRPGHELAYHPGEANLRMADVVIVSKAATAGPQAVAAVRDQITAAIPNARIVEADSPPVIDDPTLVTGRRVLVIEDGPTLTHGGMRYGAGWVAAQAAGALEVVPPRAAVGTVAEVVARYPDLLVLPAMGYSAAQMADLEASVAAADCDAVVLATPADLRRLMRIGQPVARVTYDIVLRDASWPQLLAPVLQSPTAR